MSRVAVLSHAWLAGCSAALKCSARVRPVGQHVKRGGSWDRVGAYRTQEEAL